MRRSRGAVFVLWLVSACAGAARDETGERRVERASAVVGGDVVSTVGGRPITVAHIERVTRETGLEPTAALERLQMQELLALEAERRGYADRWRVRLARRKAMIQALLDRAIHQAVASGDIEVPRVQRRYERDYGGDAGTAPAPLTGPPALEDVEDEIRRDLATETRHRRLVELVRALRDRFGVRRHEAAIREALRLELAQAGSRERRQQ